MPELVILLDDGGVLNDNSLRAGQWPRLVAEFFVPIFGGLPAAWAEANRRVAERMFDPKAWNALLDSAQDYACFERRYYCTRLGDMCEIVGLPQPAEEQCVELGAAAEAFIAPRVHAAFPGAVEAIRALGWAAQAGARTMLVGRREDAAAFQQISSLAELQPALDRLLPRFSSA
jgi:hypothetical protein